MASMNLKGLTIEIGGDTSNLQTALKSVNSEISNLQSNLRAVETALKLDPGNVTALTQKQKLLTDAISETRTKLETLKEAQKQADETMAKGGEVNQTAYRNLQSEIVRTEASLNNYESQLKETANQLNKTDDATEDAAESTDNLEEQVEDSTQASDNAADAAKKLSDGYTVMKDVVARLITDALQKLVGVLKDVAVGTVDAGMKYETAFAGVRKTVDMSAYSAEEAEKRFNDLSDGIVAMAEEIPASSAELARFGEVGGQMGVELGESNDIMLGFIRTVADLQVATNILGDEGAQSMAQFGEVTGMAQSEFSNFGSAIVELGNHLPTTENDILEMATRLAGAASQAGMAESEILGVSAALTSVGINAEAGGTAFSRVISSMQVAASTSGKLDAVLKKSGMTLRELELMSANDSKSFKELAQSLGLSSVELNRLVKSGAQLEDFGTVAGMTGKQFKAAFEEDAAGALTKFVLGLADTNDLGETATETLQEMGLTEIRVSDSLRRASNASETFTEALNLSASAWEENTALTREAETFYGTTENKLQALKNTIRNVGISLFEYFSPHMKEAIDAFKGWLQTDEAKAVIHEIGLTLEKLARDVLANLPSIIRTVSSAMQSVPAILTAITGGLSWVIKNIDGIIVAAKILMGIWVTIKAYNMVMSIISMAQSIQKLVTSTQAAAIASKLATAAQWLWNAAMSANPVGLLIAGIAALTAGIIGLVSWLGNKAYKEYKAQIEANAAAVTAFGEAVRNVQPTIADTTRLLTASGRTLSELDDAIGQTENAITSILKTALSEQRQLREDELASIKQYNAQLEALQAEKLATYRQQMTTELMKINAESNQITQAGAAQYIKNLQTALEQANGISEQSYNARLADIHNFHKAQGTLDSQAYTTDIANAKEAHDRELAENRSFYNQGLSALMDNSRKWIQTDADKWNKVISATNGSKKEYAAALAEINQDNANAFLSMYVTAKKSGAQISQETEDTARAMLGAFDNLPKGMRDAGNAALQGIVKGLKDEIPDLENAAEMSAGEIVDTLRDELDVHSPSRVTMKIGENVAEGLSVGMNNKKSWLGSRIADFASGIVSKFKQAFQIGSPSKVLADQIGQYLPSGIGEGVEENRDAALDPVRKLVSDMSDINGLNATRKIDNAFGSTSTVTLNGLSALLDKLDALYSLVKNAALRPVYVDKRKLVGAIASEMDDALGEIARRKAVGAV